MVVCFARLGTDPLQKEDAFQPTQKPYDLAVVLHQASFGEARPSLQMIKYIMSCTFFVLS